MVPPYSLGICPPTTPKTLWSPVASSLKKKSIFWRHLFLANYLNGPGVAKNWHLSKLTKKGPRRCHKVSWVQIWQKNSKGSVPNCQKEILMRHAIRWFKCKHKPPKKKNNKKTLQRTYVLIDALCVIILYSVPTYAYYCKSWSNKRPHKAIINP